MAIAPTAPATGSSELVTLAATDTGDLVTAVLDLVTAIEAGSLDNARTAASAAGDAVARLTTALDDIDHEPTDEDTAHAIHQFRRAAAEHIDAVVDRYRTPEE